MKGRNNKLTGLCLRRIHELLKAVGQDCPVALWVPDTLPIAPEDYDIFADLAALIVLEKLQPLT